MKAYKRKQKLLRKLKQPPHPDLSLRDKRRKIRLALRFLGAACCVFLMGCPTKQVEPNQFFDIVVTQEGEVQSVSLEADTFKQIACPSSPISDTFDFLEKGILQLGLGWVVGSNL